MHCLGPGLRGVEKPMIDCQFCHQKYELVATTPVARFADCDVFNTPCCGKETSTLEAAKRELVQCECRRPGCMQLLSLYLYER